MNLVLLHGFCESSSMWEEFIPLVDKSVDCICLDLPGFGTNTKKVQTLEEMADDVKDQMSQRIKYGERAVIIGHSMGGYVALQFAQKYPDMINGIGLFHSTPFADTEEIKEKRTRLITFIHEYGHEKYIETFVPGLFRRDVEDSVFITKAKRKIERIGKSTDPENIVNALIAMRNRPSSELFINNTKIPMLFIFGKWDEFFNLHQNVELAAQSGNGTTCILENSAHMGMYEEPNAAANAVNGFLKGLVKNFIKNNV